MMKHNFVKIPLCEVEEEVEKEEGKEEERRRKPNIKMWICLDEKSKIHTIFMSSIYVYYPVRFCGWWLGQSHEFAGEN